MAFGKKCPPKGKAPAPAKGKLPPWMAAKGEKPVPKKKGK